MAQEEHILSCGQSGGASGGVTGGGGVGGNGPRNGKPKKVPQRGLGVAQLEKIRLEEQRREAVEAANVLANNAIGSASEPAPSCSPVQGPNFGSSFSPCPISVSDLPPSQTNFLSPNPLYRSAPSVPVQVTDKLNGTGREEISLQSSLGNGNWPRLWNSKYNHGGEKPRTDPLGFAFRPQVNLQFESNVSVPPLPLRSPQFQRPSSSTVNASSGISSSSVLSSQMEPPSNQSFCGNNFTSSWPEEDKMVGMKRPYPFSLETPAAPSFSANFHQTYAASKSRSDELPTCSVYTAQTEPRNKDCSSSSSPPSEQNPSEVIRGDKRIKGDFLTLAPPRPRAVSPHLKSKPENPLGDSELQGPEQSYFKCLRIQENLKSQIHQLSPSRSKEQSFNFFPVKSQLDQTTTRLICGNGEKGETIDLNLKL